ncbi:MAG: PDC sensor domain-containing protein, partial [Eubacterium sp.]|nr:PDC sensor domain-containing protein [Eubacterium sp.]
MRTIKAKIIASFLLCSLLSAAIVGVISIVNSVRVAGTDAENLMKVTLGEQSEKTTALIQKIEQSVNTLANVVTDQLDKNSFLSDKTYADKLTKEVEQTTFACAENTDGAITAYIRYNPEYSSPTSGIFLSRNSTSDPFDSIPPTDFSQYDPSDAEHVGWYYIPVQNGAPIWMDPYLNANINVYMISYVVPIYMDDGTSIGIVGMDIDFEQFSSLISEMSIYDSGKAFLLNTSGNVLSDSVLET